MKAVWAGSPILARDVVDRLAVTHKWHAKTIRTLLARLVAKRVLTFQKHGRAYVYKPLVRQSDCVRAECDAFVDRVFDGAIGPMFAHFLDHRKIPEADLRELRQRLRKK